MNKRGFIVAILFFLVAGCGTTGQEEKQQEENMLNSLFVPMEESQASNDIVEEFVLGEIKGLCEVLEEKEVVSAQLYNALNDELFCVDEKTGVSYFVNSNQDWYIYRIKENEVDMAVALPATQLQMYEGSLYFMIDFHDSKKVKGVEEGDIYCYTPATGNVEFIYRPGEGVEGASRELSELKIRETGIHFSYSIPETATRHIMKYQYIPFGQIEAIEDVSKGARECWNEYYITRLENSISLIEKEAWENSIVLFDKVVPYSLVGDDVYYMDRSNFDSNGIGNAKVGKKNLVTGEVEEIDFWPIISSTLSELDLELAKKSSETGYFWWIDELCITRDGEYVWVLGGSGICCYETKTGEFTTYGSLSGKSYNLTSLYTDGQYLYGKALPNGYSGEEKEKDYIVCRVYTEKDEMSEEMRKELEEAQDYWNEKLYTIEPLIK